LTLTGPCHGRPQTFFPGEGKNFYGGKRHFSCLKNSKKYYFSEKSPETGEEPPMPLRIVIKNRYLTQVALSPTRLARLHQGTNVKVQTLMDRSGLQQTFRRWHQKARPFYNYFWSMWQISELSTNFVSFHLGLISSTFYRPNIAQLGFSQKVEEINPWLSYGTNVLGLDILRETSHKIYDWECDRLTTHRCRVMKLTVHSPDLDKLNLLKLSYGWSFLCFKPVFLNFLVSKSRSMTNFWVAVPVQESFRLFSLNFTPKYK
jgi:hypothetical protein